MLVMIARKTGDQVVDPPSPSYHSGALNIDLCRVASDRMDTRHGGGKKCAHIDQIEPNAKGYVLPSGRWPANVILTPTTAGTMNALSGTTQGVVRKPTGKPIYPTEGASMVWNQNNVTDQTERGYADSGGAGRFFWKVGEP